MIQQLDKIPDGHYEGYLWRSHKQEPDVFTQDTLFTDAELTKTKNPFVIEGWLYDADQQYSYAIRWVDGRYYRTRYELSKDAKRQTYIAHDLDGIEQFCVVEHWSPVKDELCEGMEVLRPEWTAFSGFIHPNNKAA